MFLAKVLIAGLSTFFFSVLFCISVWILSGGKLFLFYV